MNIKNNVFHHDEGVTFKLPCPDSLHEPVFSKGVLVEGQSTCTVRHQQMHRVNVKTNVTEVGQREIRMALEEQCRVGTFTMEVAIRGKIKLNLVDKKNGRYVTGSEIMRVEELLEKLVDNVEIKQNKNKSWAVYQVEGDYSFQYFNNAYIVFGSVCSLRNENNCK